MRNNNNNKKHLNAVCINCIPTLVICPELYPFPRKKNNGMANSLPIPKILFTGKPALGSYALEI